MKIAEDRYVEIKSMVADMSFEIQDMLTNSIKAFITRDYELANSVIKKDGVVDKLDNDIEDTCFKILAIYNPRAIDLRFIISILRIVVDMERIGDCCVNISKEVKHLKTSLEPKFYENLKIMSDAAYDMVKTSIDAFFNNNIELALATIKKDDYIDKMNKSIITDTINTISSSTDRVQDGVSLIYAVRNIERIADHATNICEFVYFKETGKSIKHTYFDSIKEMLWDGKSNAYRRWCGFTGYNKV